MRTVCACIALAIFLRKENTMENRQNTSIEEQGVVSALTDEPKDKEQSEIALAAKYQVKPKLIQLLDELIERKLAPPEQAKPEQPAEQEQSEELFIDEQTQERIKSYYKNLEPKAKLAAATLFQIQALDGINFQAKEGKARLTDQLWYDIENTCIETFHRNLDDVAEITLGVFDSEDVWLAGVWEGLRLVNFNV